MDFLLAWLHRTLLAIYYDTMNSGVTTVAPPGIET